MTRSWLTVDEPEMRPEIVVHLKLGQTETLRVIEDPECNDLAPKCVGEMKAHAIVFLDLYKRVNIC